ncbi:MAG: prolipoprotein diacylglyceryl transferase [Planctomycetes bacterium]|nr:prolipoprotein diacylglyceryl transferase [Planctomycetota bacterium]
MWPTVGPLRTYTIVYIGAMVLHLVLALTYAQRNGLSRRAAWAISACYTFGMALGARVLYDVLHSRLDWRNYLDPAYLVSKGLWGGPLAYLLLAVTGVLLLARHRRAYLDLVVVTLPLPMILAKAACFVNGCCYGAESDLPWAMAFPEGAEAPAGIPRHPTQLYEITALAAALLVMQVVDRTRWAGWLLFWFVLIYGVGRPLTECFRAAEKLTVRFAGMTDSQIACLAGAMVSALVLLAVGLRRKPANEAAISPTPVPPAQPA